MMPPWRYGGTIDATVDIRENHSSDGFELAKMTFANPCGATGP
jgi:hypothetical protein